MEKSQLDVDLNRLMQSMPKIMEIARDFGLDFYDMRFEVCPADVIYTFGAYGMPTRFSHWSFGKAFHRMKMSYDYNLSRIYELVINSDPCYAFLLEGNTVIQNQMVAAHVLAHCDFFKNNAAFAGTSRFMVDSMASSAERIRRYELEYGKDAVESFIDAAIAIQEHIDPHVQTIKQPKNEDKIKNKKSSPGGIYQDLLDLDNYLINVENDCTCQAGGHSSECTSKGKHNCKSKDQQDGKIPVKPQKDILLFILENGRFLKEWQQDVISVMRDEMLYFWPQIRTKIMNEGWASYWHLRIMREMEMNESDAWDFAKMHAGVIQPSRFSINPYYVGLKIFEDIEKRWDNPSEEEQRRYGRKPGQGREKIFEVREVETDQSFLRNYLTEDLVEELDLYVYRKVGNQWQIVEKDWEKTRDQMVEKLTNAGFPTIYVEDGDYNRSGELYLHHAFDGSELDVPYLEKTLPHVHTLWGRGIYLETVIEGKKCLFFYNGERVTRKFL